MFGQVIGTHVHVPRTPLFDNLLFIAGRDISLVQKAVYASRKVIHEEARHGFLWLRKRTEQRILSDLEGIVNYIRAHRAPPPA